MNPKTPRYSLRISSAPLASKENPLFLLSATMFGRRFEFVRDIGEARWFTLRQRVAFIQKYPYLRGRWIRVPTAVVARAAK